MITLKKNKIKKQKITKKKFISYILITIILGTLAYFLGSTIATQVMKNKHQKENKDNFSDLTKIDTIEEISLETLLDTYNRLMNQKYKIDKEKIENHKITINDIGFQFIEENQNIEIMTIEYKEETEDIQNIILTLIKANNNNIDENSAKLLYDKTKQTLNEQTKTSEYFQYKGIETSLKKKEDTYQFRIGRITK